MIAELVAWLREQVDVDERVVRAVADPQWTYERMVDDVALQTDHVLHIGDWVVGAGGGEDELTPSVARHIARHDPARALAEVAAKRAHIARWELVDAQLADAEFPSAIRNELLSVRRAYALVLADDALVYAGRPGWREEWRA